MNMEKRRVNRTGVPHSQLIEAENAGREGSITTEIEALVALIEKGMVTYGPHVEL